MDNAHVVALLNRKSESRGEGAHGHIFRENRGDNARKLFIAAHLDEPGHELRSKPLMMELIRNQNCNFGLTVAILADQPANCDDFGFTVRRIGALGDESPFPDRSR